MIFCVFNRPGSVIVDFNVQTTSDDINLVSANSELASSLRSQGFPVSETAFSESGRGLMTIYKFSSINVVHVYNYAEILMCLTFYFSEGWTIYRQWHYISWDKSATDLQSSSE